MQDVMWLDCIRCFAAVRPVVSFSLCLSILILVESVTRRGACVLFVCDLTDCLPVCLSVCLNFVSIVIFFFFFFPLAIPTDC